MTARCSICIRSLPIRRVAIAADPPRTYGAGEPVNLGHPSWVIGEPYGTDMIIAVASSEPLFDRPRPRNAETADVYLRDLQAAIDALPRSAAPGWRVPP